MLVYSAVVSTDIQLAFVGLESEFYDLQKKLVETVFYPQNLFCRIMALSYFPFQ